MANMFGVSAYQQANSIWNQKTGKKNGVTKNDTAKSGLTETDNNTNGSNTTTDTASLSIGTQSGSAKVQTTTLKTIRRNSSLMPVNNSDYGVVIGDVELSDAAKDYYDKLKSKYHNMDFILVSEDMKSQVQANAGAYGNASKPVVLINAEKLEKMATDDAYREKYEAIIELSQLKLQETKDALAGSGANVTNFGITVDANGNSSFFATMEKQSQKKAEEKKAAQKQEAKVKEKKLAEKKAAEKKQAKKNEEKLAEKKKAEKAEKEKHLEESMEEARKERLGDNVEETNKETSEDTPAKPTKYVEMEADSISSLVQKVSAYASSNSARSVSVEEASFVGGQIDFKG